MNRIGQAHEVREEERREIFEGIQQKIIAWENGFDTIERKITLYRILIVLLGRQLDLPQDDKDVTHLPGIPKHIAEQMSGLFLSDVTKRVTDFEHSEEEGAFLFAQLLEWVAGQFFRLRHSVLETQQRREPQRVLHAESPMSPTQYK